MPSKEAGTRSTRAYVWVWLPGASEPVVAGVVEETGRIFSGDQVLGFAYASSYLARQEAISLFTPELPLRKGAIDPTDPVANAAWSGLPVAQPRASLALAGSLRDSAPDAWGRRVLNLRIGANPEVDLSELTCLLQSGSDRIGGVDFQRSASEYVPRGEFAALEQLMTVADLVEKGEPIPDDLAAAAGHGASIGGARPKALLEDHGRHLIAKFSSSSDSRPVVKAEALGMLLAARVGIDVAPVEVVRAAGKDVLLVERFDRPGGGTRRSVLSALTILGLGELESRHSGYAMIADSIRYPGWVSVREPLREMFTRLVFNICIGNNDDHMRNHAAFWDGHLLELTPAYDLVPSPRNSNVSSQAIGITRDGERASQLRVARKAAADFLLDDARVEDIIDHVVTTIKDDYNDVADQARLTRAEREQFMGREILNDYITYGQA